MQPTDANARRSAIAGAASAGFVAPEVIGARREVPLLDGRRVPQVFLDNAASTKPLREVRAALARMEEYYSNIHRGTGYDSVFCTHRYEEARRIIAAFVGGDPEHDVALPVRNTTEGLNLLATTFGFGAHDVVLTSLLEHHSNDLPWRGRARVEHITLREDATFDTDALERRLRELAGRVRVVALTGASNVTGEVLPIHDIARRVHAHGARLVVDAAQLAPHRAIRMRPYSDPEHLDFVVLSAHKLNAPYGEGVIVGPHEHFSEAAPYLQGGGAVYAVGLDHVIWADTPERQEAGTPNILGLFALAAAIRVYERIGFDRNACCAAWPRFLRSSSLVAAIRTTSSTGSGSSRSRWGISTTSSWRRCSRTNTASRCAPAASARTRSSSICCASRRSGSAISTSESGCGTGASCRARCG
jgi:cysteine desulfurase/selenocysteine lyase